MIEARDAHRQPQRQLRQPAVLAWLRLARVFQKVQRTSAGFLRGWGLSVAQFDALAQLAAAEGITQQELADRLLVTKGNVSQLLDRLEARDLVRRRQEGRATRLALTAEGRRIVAEVVPAQERSIARQFAPLTLEERSQLLHLLRKLDRGMG